MVNLAADTALLCAVTRIMGCFSWYRIICASALSALYAVLAAARPFWAALPIQMTLLCLVSMILAGHFRSGIFRIAMLLVGGTLMSGGISGLFSALPCSLLRALSSAWAGSLLLASMLAARHPLRDSWQIGVSLRVGKCRVCFQALIDTGNRLIEPISGLPVLIAESGLLKGVLPQDGWRLLRYGALGGCGQLACFHPSEVWILDSGRRRRAPDIWIAVSPEPLPGAARALAPCEFAMYSR